MTTPVTEGATTAVAGVSAAGAVASAAGAPAGVAGMGLPNTGTGGHGAPNTSITFMLVAGAISALAGAAMFLMGRRRELEDDGLS
jgi:hypothetical protein